MCALLQQIANKMMYNLPPKSQRDNWVAFADGYFTKDYKHQPFNSKNFDNWYTASRISRRQYKSKMYNNTTSCTCTSLIAIQF